MHGENGKLRALVVFGIAGSLAFWVSQPTFFVFISCFLTLCLVFSKRRDQYHLLWLIGIGGLWGINFLVDYLISLRYLATNSGLLNYWNGSFAPLPPWSNFSWYFNALSGFLNDPVRLPFTIITVGLIILGIFSFAFRKRPLMLVLTAPFLLTLIASALREIPFQWTVVIVSGPTIITIACRRSRTSSNSFNASE